ncbi:hypothetical protein AVEN_14801-1 [Araneus ventricosus]|uniref:Secreted protein n=1 Tax=Araneus ventricosus TaxID=182803 RepID=A0A4Y2FKJ9_ARAVE|nr:hypothetical protein AVEN_14801-1 [Araneus ventricosus]
MLARKLCMALLWLIPIRVERRRVSSSDSWQSLLARVLTYLHLLPSSRSACIGDGTCPLEFHDKFCHGVVGYLRSVLCIESARYMTGGITPNQQNNVNPFFLLRWHLFSIVLPSSK